MLSNKLTLSLLLLTATSKAERQIRQDETTRNGRYISPDIPDNLLIGGRMTQDQMCAMIVDIVNLRGPIRTSSLFLDVAARMGTKLDTVLFGSALEEVVTSNRVVRYGFVIPQLDGISITNYLYFSAGTKLL